MTGIMFRLALLVWLASCSTPPAEAPPDDAGAGFPVPPIPLLVPREAPDAARHAAAVRSQYQAAAAREPALVMAPNATTDLVLAIHAADLAARRALRAVELAGKQPSHAQLTAAREAVDRLRTVLQDSESEGGTGDATKEP